MICIKRIPAALCVFWLYVPYLNRQAKQIQLLRLNLHWFLSAETGWDKRKWGRQRKRRAGNICCVNCRTTMHGPVSLVTGTSSHKGGSTPQNSSLQSCPRKKQLPGVTIQVQPWTAYSSSARVAPHKGQQQSRQEISDSLGHFTQHPFAAQNCYNYFHTSSGQ